MKLKVCIVLQMAVIGLFAATLASDAQQMAEAESRVVTYSVADYVADITVAPITFEEAAARIGQMYGSAGFIRQTSQGPEHAVLEVGFQTIYGGYLTNAIAFTRNGDTWDTIFEHLAEIEENVNATVLFEATP